MLLTAYCIATGTESAMAQRLARAEKGVTAEEVRQSIRRGVRSLKQQQDEDGSWNKFRFTGDVTALCTLALLNAEENPNDPHVQQGIEYLVNIAGNRIDATYSVSLRIMVLAAADPDGNKYRRAVQKDVDWLIGGQRTKRPFTGGWGYQDGRGGSADSSNSQFALLALHEAGLMGAEIPDRVWKSASGYWDECFARGGGFSYNTGGGQVTGSMTSAGISSRLIINENLADVEALFNGDRANCCGQNQGVDQIAESINWLAANFTVRGNPSGRGRGDTGTQLYFLYGLERAGRLSGQRFFGPHDWYRAGSAQLLSQQNAAAGGWRGRSHGEENKDIATSLALLFLSKGKRPVAIGKYQYGDGDNWNYHPGGVHYLSRTLEEDWHQKLNWQTVNGDEATVDDLLETPVLFLSGRESIAFSAKQKETLKKYLENGGFLFAEACQGDGCGPAEFDRAFRDLMAELFPDSRLEPLDPQHPIWTSQHQIFPDADRPLLGLQACCRTSVVYCPTNLSCYWSLRRPVVTKYLADRANDRRYKTINDRVEYCSKIGVNVVTYATGRELRDKGDTPTLEEDMQSVLANRSIQIPKLAHGGGQDEAPNAWRNILKELKKTGLSVDLSEQFVAPDLEALSDYPFVFMHGRSRFEFTPAQREALALYLQLGGFVFADAICSSPEFATSFRSEMRKVLGEPMSPIPAGHEIWTNPQFGEPIANVTRQVKDGGGGQGFRMVTGPPELEGHEFDGRLVVVFSPHDLSCAMESPTVSQCEGHTHEDATRISRNVLLYRLRGN